MLGFTKVSTAWFALVGWHCYDRRNREEKVSFGSHIVSLTIARWDRSSFIMANQEAERAKLEPKAEKNLPNSH